MGGMLRAIETGYVQREIQEAAYEYQKAVESNEAVVVGVNRFHSGEADPIPILRIDEQIERDQIERLRSLRDRRDAVKADRSLKSLGEAAAGTENMLPRILDCVESEVTVGEISNNLRSVWGEYREAVTV